MKNTPRRERISAIAEQDDFSPVLCVELEDLHRPVNGLLRRGAAGARALLQRDAESVTFQWFGGGLVSTRGRFSSRTVEWDGKDLLQVSSKASSEVVSVFKIGRSLALALEKRAEEIRKFWSLEDQHEIMCAQPGCMLEPCLAVPGWVRVVISDELKWVPARTEVGWTLRCSVQNKAPFLLKKG